MSCAARRWHMVINSTRWTRDQAYEQVYRMLLSDSVLRRTMQLLDQNARRALQALQASGGSMPCHAFSRDFGAIRPCHQRPHDAPKPWVAPHSPVEHLWLLGMIEITRNQPPHIHLTDEVIALLPQLPVRN